MADRRPRGWTTPSPAMVVACVSLFVGLSGVGTAAVVALKKGQVKSIHIANGQVKRPDIAANAVASAKVAQGSLLELDFAPGQLPQGPQGSQGPRGRSGPATAAVSSTALPPTPPPPQLVENATITTTVAGRLLVMAQLSGVPSSSGVRFMCAAPGSCSVTYGIYVDGEPVPGAARTITAFSGSADVPVVFLHGLTEGIPAGTYEVELRLFFGANSGVVTSANAQVQAIAIA